MGKMIVNCITVIYIVIAIAVTVCLLTYNENKVSQFGEKSLIIINKDEDDFKYKKGDLVIVNKENYGAAQEGDTVFFYNSKDTVKIAKIVKRLDYGEVGITYTIDGNYEINPADIIGTSANEKVIGKVGGILKFLESKWGFLFLIVFPSLLAFLHEVSQLIAEITGNRNKESE